MKNFLIFAGPYERRVTPDLMNRGWNSLKGTAETLEEAKLFKDSLLRDKDTGLITEIDWVQIVDLSTMKIVSNSL